MRVLGLPGLPIEDQRERNETMKLRTLAAALAAVLICAAGHAFAAIVQCAPYQQVTGAAFPGTSSPGYTADGAGIITGVSSNDVESMIKAGCDVVGVGANTLVGRLLGVNMNQTADTDQQIPLWLPPGQYVRFTKISMKNCSGSVTTANGGIYTGTLQGGTAIVAAQGFSAITGGSLALDLTIATTPGKTEFGGSTPPALYFDLSTAQGSAMTCDVFVYGDVGQ